MRAERCARTWSAVLLVMTSSVLTPVAWAGTSAWRRPATAPPPAADDHVPAVARGWPVGRRPEILRGWDPPAGPYGPGHRGVDLAAAPGDPARAVAAGRVVFAGRVAGRGVVSVDLADTGDPPLRTTYEPVSASVGEGDEVEPGGELGVLETPTAHCPRACLHWGLRRGEVYLDPLALLPPWLLRAGPSRLLPLHNVPLP
ncbi:peptidoglycan DD-metalloendopeptidase family protein [Streptomyces sp. NPDC093675]|uniref:peptidoglycan DD-metalloendopeptidase family protein n=1 Tax=Streptomyces sp. NPDC093675 TaxID=3366049 RepID=UPI0037F3F502